MDDHILQPWDTQADRFQKERGGELDVWRNFVIFVWLERAGDTRPFVDWVLRYDHQPNRLVRLLLANMMAEDPNPKLSVQFQLVKKKRAGTKGRPLDLVAEERDHLLYKNITRIMDQRGKGSYESAIAEVAQLEGITPRMAKRAYARGKKFWGKLI